MNKTTLLLDKICQVEENALSIVVGTDLFLVQLLEKLEQVLEQVSSSTESWVDVATNLLNVFLSCISLKHASTEHYAHIFVYLGFIDVVHQIFTALNGPLDSLSCLVPFIDVSTKVIDCLVGLALQDPSQPVYVKQTDNLFGNSLLESMYHNNLLGLVTMLDAVLLYQGGTYRIASESDITDEWIQISHRALHILNGLCSLDLTGLQSFLSDNGLCAELFHFMLFWLQYHQAHPSNPILEPFLDELLLLLGNVCLLH